MKLIVKTFKIYHRRILYINIKIYVTMINLEEKKAFKLAGIYAYFYDQAYLCNKIAKIMGTRSWLCKTGKVIRFARPCFS